MFPDRTKGRHPHRLPNSGMFPPAQPCNQAQQQHRLTNQINGVTRQLVRVLFLQGSGEKENRSGIPKVISGLTMNTMDDKVKPTRINRGASGYIGRRKPSNPVSSMPGSFPPDG